MAKSTKKRTDPFQRVGFYEGETPGTISMRLYEQQSDTYIETGDATLAELAKFAGHIMSMVTSELKEAES